MSSTDHFTLTKKDGGSWWGGAEGAVLLGPYRLSGLVLVFQGFSVEGQENLQEILSKQLLLCQFLMALSVVRTGDVSFPSPLLSKGPLRPYLCLMRACTGLG